MPSTWSKPYADILKENAPLWKEAITRKARIDLVNTVADKIMEQVKKDGDKHIDKLHTVSLYFTICQFISLSIF
jgi:hypothetical protein